MGDRSRAEVSLRVSDYQKLVQKYGNGVEESFFDKFDATVEVADQELITLVSQAIDGAIWEELEEALEKEKIDFDLHRNEGWAYEESWKIYRTIDGVYQGFEKTALEMEVGAVLKHIWSMPEEDNFRMKYFESMMKKYEPFDAKPLRAVEDKIVVDDEHGEHT